MAQRIYSAAEMNAKGISAKTRAQMEKNNAGVRAFQTQQAATAAAAAKARSEELARQRNTNGRAPASSGSTAQQSTAAARPKSAPTTTSRGNTPQFSPATNRSTFKPSSSGPMNIGFGMNPPSAPAMRGTTAKASPFSAPKAAPAMRGTTSAASPFSAPRAAAPAMRGTTPARSPFSAPRPTPSAQPASRQPASMSTYDRMMAARQPAPVRPASTFIPTPSGPTFDEAALNNTNLNDYIQNTMADAGVGAPAAAAAASPVDVGLGMDMGTSARDDLAGLGSTSVGNVAAAGDIVGAGDAGLGGASAQADLAALDNAQADAIANADNARADAITNAEIGAGTAAGTGGGTSAQADLAGFDQIGAALPGQVNAPAVGAALPGQVNGPTIATLPGQVNGPTIATLPGQVNGPPIATLPGQVNGPPIATLPGQVNGPPIATLPGQVNAPPPVISSPVAPPPVAAPPVTPTPVVAAPAAVTPPAAVAPPAAAAPVTTGQGISDDEMRRHLAANPGRTEDEIRTALGQPVAPAAPTPATPAPVLPPPAATTSPPMAAPVVPPTPAPYAGAIPIALATGPAAFGSNVMTPKAPTTPFMPGISSNIPSATPLRSGMNEFEQEVIRRTPVSGGPAVPPDILPPDRFMPPQPGIPRRPGGGNLDPHTLGSYKQLSNNFGATMDRAGNLVATSAMPSADAIRQGQLTARIAGQNAQLSGTLGSAVDRFGNPIAAPQMPRFFREGGEAIGDNTSLAEYLQQQGDSSIDTDPLGTAQQYLADVDAVKPMPAPTRRSVKRVSRGASSDASTSKEMNLKLPALTSSKQMTLNTSSTPEEDQNKPKGTAREQMEDLVRSYELKIRAAKNRARGLSADVFGAPTLEGPSLTKNTLAKRRFAEGGEVKKSEAVDAPQVTGVNRVVDFIAQRLPAGAFPTAGRTFLETVQGNRDPITESSFSRDELEVLRQLASKNKGAVRYKDYDALAQELRSKGKEADSTASLFSLGSPLGNVRNTLGQFTYKLDPKGDLVLEDAYDFNPPGAPGQTREARTADYGTFGPYNMIREYAGEKVPPGKGRPVRVNLGKPMNKK